jgi:ferritin
MRSIKKYVDHINEEIEGAKEYAENYIEWKARGNIQRANSYRDMAQDELNHAMNIHEFAVKDIEELKKVYTPPIAMLEKWEHEHKRFIEEVAHVKQILSM